MTRKNDYSRMEETLRFGVPEGILSSALVELMTLHPHCERCFKKYADIDHISRQEMSMFGFPACFEDHEGKTCYVHAHPDAKPLPNWRGLLYASVALASASGYLGVSDETHEAIFTTSMKNGHGRSNDKRYGFDAGLRFYAAKLGDDEYAENYATGIREKAMNTGLMAYAAASGDPSIRPTWVLTGFDEYRRIRWPKSGDRCPKCSVPMHGRKGSIVCKNPDCGRPPTDKEIRAMKGRVQELLNRKTKKKGKS